MFGRNVLFVALASVAAGTAAWANPPEAGRPTIEWLIWDVPPYHMSADSKTLGAQDELVDWLAARLPDYDHVREFVPNASRTEILRTRDLVCAVGHYMTEERAAYTQFTNIPPFFAAPARLIVPAQSAANFERFRDGSGAIDLGALVADRTLTGGREVNRSTVRRSMRCSTMRQPPARCRPGPMCAAASACWPMDGSIG